MKDYQNEHLEPNRAYAEFKEKFEQKYSKNLRSLSDYHGGLMPYISFSILCENARAFARGDVKEIWPGAGVLNMTGLCADVKMLDSLAKYNW